MKIILCVRIYATFVVAETKPEKKKSGLYGIRSLDLCDTSLRADEMKLWLTPNQSLVIVCTQATAIPVQFNW